MPSIHYSISKIKLAQVIFKMSFENFQIITSRCLLGCQLFLNVVPHLYPRKYLISFYHISSYLPIMQG